MYKIAFLGVENSHANAFLEYIYDKKAVSDIEVVGVYSNEPEAAAKLSEKYGIENAPSPDAFVGRVDGIVITARDGKYHYPYAKPYFESGIPMFIDKPITTSLEDAKLLLDALRTYKNKYCGCSSLKFSKDLAALKKEISETCEEDVYGGFLRAPISLSNNYGNFWFYSQHLVQMACETFGYRPVSVFAIQNGKTVTVSLNYGKYTVSLEYVDGNYKYFAYASTKDGMKGGALNLDGVFDAEFNEYYGILKGGEQPISELEFIAPVAILAAIEKSLAGGLPVTVEYPEGV